MSVDGAWETKEDSDYSACTIWGVVRDKIYLLDMWRGKCLYPDFKQKLLSIYSKHNPETVLVEDTASGKAFRHELENKIPIHAVHPAGSKEFRANIVSDIIQTGRVYIPAGHQILYDFLEEVSSFPRGKHDDLVDTMTQALKYLNNYSVCPISIL